MRDEDGVLPHPALETVGTKNSSVHLRRRGRGRGSVHDGSTISAPFRCGLYCQVQCSITAQGSSSSFYLDCQTNTWTLVTRWMSPYQSSSTSSPPHPPRSSASSVFPRLPLTTYKSHPRLLPPPVSLILLPSPFSPSLRHQTCLPSTLPRSWKQSHTLYTLQRNPNSLPLSIPSLLRTHPLQRPHASLRRGHRPVGPRNALEQRSRISALFPGHSMQPPSLMFGDGRKFGYPAAGCRLSRKLQGARMS